MKFTALGVVHDETERAAKESGEASFWARLKEEETKKKRTTHNDNQGNEENRPYTVGSRQILLMRLKVLMLNQNLRWHVVEFLIGKTSQSVQVN